MLTTYQEIGELMLLGVAISEPCPFDIALLIADNKDD